MSHALLLSAEVTLVVAVRLDFDRHVLYDFESVAIKTYALGWVVGDKTKLGDLEIAKNLCAYAIVAKVRVESEVDVGIHGVHALLLQNVSGNLGSETDAATFLLEIHDSAFAFLLNKLH